MKIHHFSPFLFARFTILATLLLTCFATNSLAWEGYDFESRDRIDIGPGNLVREGLTIQFYDMAADDYHTGKVVLMEGTAGGTRITILDLDTKKERIFIMQE